MEAVVQSDGIMGKMIKVRIVGDPFDVLAEYTQLTKKNTKQANRERKQQMPTSTKELRKEARRLKIKGWEEMDRDDLADAIAAKAGDTEDDEEETATRPAKRAAKATKSTRRTRQATESDDDEDEAPKQRRTSAGKRAAKKAPASKKAAAKKAAAPKSNVSGGASGANPFRDGTNLFHVTEALIKGGKRSALVKSLRSKMEFNPRKQSEDEFDADAEIDRRLKVVGYILQNQHGFEYVLDGRGPDSKVHVVPPS